MSAAVRESSHVSRKIVTHGGPISGQSYSATTANSLENNLDALLEDLQTSVSRSATPNARTRPRSPNVEYRVAANPTRVVSEARTVSPTRGTTTTTEKFVSTGPAGTASGIPGLELLDAELQDVQPGQSKTVAYKQVSYQYNKSIDGKPVVADSWAMSDNLLDKSGNAIIDEFHESSYEESRSDRRHRSPEPSAKLSTINRELLYDTSTSRSKQNSPILSSRQKDVKFIHESSGSRSDPRSAPSPVSSNVQKTTQHMTTTEEYETTDHVAIPSPTATVPLNLAPGPNTKVTTTIKTYTYELPGAPETYLPGGTLPRGEQTITYTLPRGGSTEKSVTYKTSSETDFIDRPGSSSARYTTPSPTTDITAKAKTYHKEAKFYREEHVGGPQPPVSQPSVVYHVGPHHDDHPPIVDSKTSVTTRDEKYYQISDTYLNGHGPRSGDRPDHPGNTTIIYQNQTPIINESHTTINRIEEHYNTKSPSPHKPANYYTALPPQTTPGPHQNSTTVYKYSNTTSTIPPNKHPDDHEVLLPKPFPTGGVQVYPSKPSTPTNMQEPPRKLEDLMASFSDSEREVLDDIEKQEKQRIVRQNSGKPKKEVEFVSHTPPKVQSKNVAGPPVYYPPGSAEFTRKEESGAAMYQAGGGWQKASGKYEYEASSKSQSKSSSGKAVVPVCLPLCCALPCVIM